MNCPNWESRLPKKKEPNSLSGESGSYLSVKCTSCPYKDVCLHFNSSNPGCTERKLIYDNIFTKVNFKTEDAISLNRLRLLTRYYVELILMRNFGAKFSKPEVQIYRATLSELSKLSIDKKGELLDTKTKAILPWETSEDDERLKKEIEEKRKLELEVLELRKLKKKKQEKTHGN